MLRWLIHPRTISTQQLHCYTSSNLQNCHTSLRQLSGVAAHPPCMNRFGSLNIMSQLTPNLPSIPQSLPKSSALSPVLQQHRCSFLMPSTMWSNNPNFCNGCWVWLANHFSLPNYQDRATLRQLIHFWQTIPAKNFSPESHVLTEPSRHSAMLIPSPLVGPI